MKPPKSVNQNGDEDSREPLIDWKKLEQAVDKIDPAQLTPAYLLRLAKSLRIFSFRYISRALILCAEKDIRTWLGGYRKRKQAKDEFGNPVGKLPYQSVPNPDPEGAKVTRRVYKRDLDNPEEYADRARYWYKNRHHADDQLLQVVKYGLEAFGDDMIKLIPPDYWENIRRIIDQEPPEGPMPPGLNGGPPQIG